MSADLADVSASALAAWNAAIAPDPPLRVSEWADSYRVLDRRSSAEPGPWRTARAPYLQGPMDTLSPLDPARRVVIMAGTQLGKTECGNNWIGYVIHRAPGPMLMVQPTVDVAKKVSKQRLKPMIESTPVLHERVRESRSRDSGNTIQMKEFDGGLLIITGANSASGLASMPIRYLFMDEIDLYEGDVEGQGDPVALAERRTDTFGNAKVLLTSTPSTKGASRIEDAYLASDQRHYFVPCPHCGALDWLHWKQIKWEPAHPDAPWLECATCLGRIQEGHKTRMLAGGEWRATAAGDGRTVGFHLSALYSPIGWKSWADIVTEFLEAKDNPFLLKTWVNTRLGETWEEREAGAEPHVLLARVEPYTAVPAGVGVLIAAVDVQADRLELQVMGFGAGEEAWLIAYHQIPGDPGQRAVWRELDLFLARPIAHANGQKLPIELTVIDSNYQSEEVYRFCRGRTARRIYPIRGGNLKGAELVPKPTVHNRYRMKLWTLCVDTGKHMVYSRLALADPGPGYIHLPDAVASKEYVDQLTAEKSIRRWRHGRSERVWLQVRDRNEALDLTVYCLAGLYIGGPVLIANLEERAARFAQPPDTEPPADETPPGGAAPRRPNWIDSWRM